MDAVRRAKTGTKTKAKLTRLEKIAGLNLIFLGIVWSTFRYWSDLTSIHTYLTHLPPFVWMLPTLILIPFCLFSKKKRAILTCAGATFLSLRVAGFSLPSPFPLTPSEGKEVTVMTFNIRHAESGWDGIRRLIQDRKPDIVCFQEADDARHVGSAIAKLPGYYVEQHKGLAIAAKEKPSKVRSIRLSEGTASALEAQIGEVTVVNVHLASFRSLRSHRQVASIAATHRAQVETLVQTYAKTPDCVIAGDFNNPPRGVVFQKLTRTFNDAFGQKGWGFGYTFPSHLPVERIDYAFTTTLVPLSAEVVATTKSDHRPVFFKLLVNRPT